jgi:hypothetical protein
MSATAQASGAAALDDEPVKRLLAMEGLGIRDLKRCGDDLLILAGPDHRPVRAVRDLPLARLGAGPAAGRAQGAAAPPERIVEIPFGRGKDHPEGLALWIGDGGQARQILVIYDSPAKSRCDVDAGTIKADLFDLPE